MWPTSSDIVYAVAVAGSGWWAEVLTKALMVDGLAAMRTLLEPGASCSAGEAHGLVVDSGGRVSQSSGLASFIHAPTGHEVNA